MKLVELSPPINSSQISLVSNSTLTNPPQQQQHHQQQNGTHKPQSNNPNQQQQQPISASANSNNTFTNCYGYESTINLAASTASSTSNNTDQLNTGVLKSCHPSNHQYYVPSTITAPKPPLTPQQQQQQLHMQAHHHQQQQQHYDESNCVGHRSLSEPRPQSIVGIPPPPIPPPSLNHIQLTQSNFTGPEISYQQQSSSTQQAYANQQQQQFIQQQHQKILGPAHDYYTRHGTTNGSVETYDNLNEHNNNANNSHQSRIDSSKFNQLSNSNTVQQNQQQQQQLQNGHYNYFDR